MGLSRIVSEKKAITSKFSHPRFNLTDLLREFPLKFCDGGGGSKIERCSYRTVRKCYDVCTRLDTLPPPTSIEQSDSRMDLS